MAPPVTLLLSSASSCLNWSRCTLVLSTCCRRPLTSFTRSFRVFFASSSCADADSFECSSRSWSARRSSLKRLISWALASAAAAAAALVEASSASTSRTRASRKLMTSASDLVCTSTRLCASWRSLSSASASASLPVSARFTSSERLTSVSRMSASTSMAETRFSRFFTRVMSAMMPLSSAGLSFVATACASLRPPMPPSGADSAASFAFAVASP
mmetsp:Transcript_45660/g.142889  ORF Transcript_45660/g.142889 Transcript_45660/m.142889 type:complete len:215 (-) Transcript_45660:114-758(-)